jgi:hypothetical protein
MFKYILLAALLAVASCQFQDITIIDDFSIVTPTIIILIPANPSFPIINQAFVTDPAILGSERDLQLKVNQGLANLVLTAGVSGGTYSCSTPNNAQGVSLLQYDGIDGSMNLKADGLFSDPDNDFTIGGAFALRTFIKVDIGTTIDVFVYSGSSSAFCKKTITLPGDNTNHEYILNYNTFTNTGGGCDFSNVGALEFSVNMAQNVDVIIEFFTTYGPVPVTPTATPSRTRSPAASASPSPTISDTCVCICPQFHCELIRYDDNDKLAFDDFVDLSAFFNFWNLI